MPQSSSVGCVSTKHRTDMQWAHRGAMKDAPWPSASQQQSFKFNTPGFFKKYDFLLVYFSFNNTV